MPPGSPSHDIWTEEHAAPTLADIALPPRRRLRDGSSASNSDPANRKSKRTRVGSSTSRSSRSATADGEQSRRLPRLRTRERPETRSPSPPLVAEETGTEGTSTAQSGPELVAHEDAPAPVDGDDDSPGPPRFTAEEKGKGKAMSPTPEVIEIQDDEPQMDESIQFLQHAPASPRPVKEVESVIAEDDALSAYSECALVGLL